MKLSEKQTMIDMNEADYRDLLNQVKETIAIEIKPTYIKRSFGIADMWHLRRNARSAKDLMRR